MDKKIIFDAMAVNQMAIEENMLKVAELEKQIKSLKEHSDKLVRQNNEYMKKL